MFKDSKFVYTQDGTLTLQVEYDGELLDNVEGYRTIISCEMKDKLTKILGYEPGWYA